MVFMYATRHYIYLQIRLHLEIIKAEHLKDKNASEPKLLKT